VTSAPVAGPAAGPAAAASARTTRSSRTTTAGAVPGSSRTSAGQRAARPSGLRRASEVVLVTGTVLAVAAAFGPHWATRAGIAVAVVSAVAACVFAWRELFAVERSHARTLLQTSQRHGQQLREEREHNASVVDSLVERVRESTGTVGEQRRTIASLRHEVFALEGDRTQLRGDLQQRDRVIGSLRSTVRAQDSTIRGLEERLREVEPGTTELETTSEVRHMPRRRELEAAAPAAEPLDRRTLATAFAGVLPNYEEDRRLA